MKGLFCGGCGQGHGFSVRREEGQDGLDEEGDKEVFQPQSFLFHFAKLKQEEHQPGSQETGAVAWMCLSFAECFKQKTFPPWFSVSTSLTGGFGKLIIKAPSRPDTLFPEPQGQRWTRHQTPGSIQVSAPLPTPQPCSLWPRSMGRGGRMAIWL